MKQIFMLISLLVATFTIANSQVEYSATNYKSLENKLQKNNLTFGDPKKKDLSKTWLERAKLMQDIADVSTQFLRPNMALTEIKIVLKEPKEINKTTEKEGNIEHQIDQYVYDYFTLNVENKVLKSWVETKTIFPNALDTAVDCYKKAIELDADGKLEKKITEGLKSITPIYQKNALNYYALKDFKNAYHAFKAIVSIDDMKQVNIKDTVITYYTGVFASESGMKDEALVYLQRAKEMNYWMKEPTLFVYLSGVYLAKKDSANALAVLKEGFMKVPGNASILNELINFYLSSGDSKAALEYLSKAIANEPTNKSYYFAQGTLFDKLDSTKSAISSYKKVIGIDTSFFDAYFNLAVVYYNQAVKLIEKANEEQDNNKYLEMKSLADEQFKNAIPYMEKAHEINPKDRQSLESLKNMYYRLKMNDQLERVKKLLDELN